jgi:hypothetical protein
MVVVMAVVMAVVALQWLFSDFETSETAEPEPKKKKLAAVK